MKRSNRAGRRKPICDVRSLEEWLIEWRLEQALSEEYPPEQAPPDASAVGLRPVRAEAGRLSDGPLLAADQIRLLYPEEAATAVRPLYIFLAGLLPSGVWVGVPFGRLATPAIPGEWRTGLRKLPVRVLCAWNARRLTAQRLRRSWRVSTPTPRWCMAARRITTGCCTEAEAWAQTHRSALSGLEARHRFGPPVLHPLDPRWSYVAQEADRLDGLGPPWGRLNSDRCYRGSLQPGVVPGLRLYAQEAKPSARKAAETPDAYADPRSPNPSE